MFERTCNILHDDLIDFLAESRCFPTDPKEIDAFCARLYHIICQRMKKFSDNQWLEFSEFLVRELAAERSLGFQRFLRCINARN